MSFSIHRRHLAFYRTTIHPLFSALLPFFFLLIVDQLIRKVLPVFPFSTGTIAPFLLAAGIEEAVLGNLLFKERAAFIERIRELAAVLVAVYLVLALPRIWSTGLVFHMQFLYPLLMVAVQWLLSRDIHATLREREILLNALVGKRGQSLRRSLRDSSFQAALVIRAMRGLRRLILYFQFQVVALLVVAGFLNVYLDLWGSFLVLMHLVGGLLFFGMLAQFTEEQVFLSDGIPISAGLERRRVLSMILVLFSAIILAIAVARNASLLPLSLLLSLLERIGQIFHIRGDSQDWASAVQRVLEARRQRYQSLLSQSQVQIHPLAILLLEFSKRLFFTLVFMILFAFLSAPLFSQFFLARLEKLHPLHVLGIRIQLFTAAVIRTFLRLVHWLRSGGKAGWYTYDQESAQKNDGMRSRKDPRPTLQKKIQMSRVLRAFVLLIRWGEKLGVHYIPGNTPQEYTGRLAQAIPAGADQLSFIVCTFEEVMFSAHLVPAENIARYMQTIRVLCAFRPVTP